MKQVARNSLVVLVIVGLVFVWMIFVLAGCASMFSRETLGHSEAAKAAADPSAYSNFPIAFEGYIIDAEVDNGHTLFTMSVEAYDHRGTVYFWVDYPVVSRLAIAGEDVSVLGYLRPERLHGLNAFGAPISQPAIDAVALVTATGASRLASQSELYDSWKSGRLFKTDEKGRFFKGFND